MPDVKDCGLFISRLLLIMLLGLAGSCPAATPAKETRFESASVLTIAGSRDLPPFSMLNEAGEPAGIGVDLWRLWSQKSGHPIRFHLTDIPNSLQELKEGSADFHLGLLVSEERGKWLAYSKPYLQTPALLYFPAESGQRDALADFAHARIGFRGPPPRELLQNLFPSAEIVSFEDIPQMIDAIQAGKIDAFIADQPSADLALLNLGLRGDFTRLEDELFQLSLRSAVSKENAPLLQEIENGLNAISYREMQQILDRWLGRQAAYGVVFLPQDEVNLNQVEREWIERHRQLRVAIDPKFAPYEFQDVLGRHQGVSADYLKLLGRKLGLSFIQVPSGSWEESLQLAFDKQVDVLPLLNDTPEREAHLVFTKPYITTQRVIITRNQREDIRGELDLRGQRLVLPEGYSVITHLHERMPDIAVTEVADIPTALRKVATGAADATILSAGVASYWLERNEITNLRIAGTFGQSSNLAMACRDDWPALAGILQKGLDAIDEEERLSIRRRWISLSMDHESFPQIDLNLTQEEKAWLADHPQIEIGVMNAWPPMDYIDAEGNARGIGADFVRLLNQRLGGVLSLHPGNWDDLYLAVKEKRLPALMGITPHASRADDFLFTDAYLSIPYVIIARKESDYARRIEDLAGRRVAVEKGFIMGRLLAERYPGIKTLGYADTSDALDAVAKGEADAYIGNRAVALYLIEQELISNLQIQGKIDESSVNAIGVRKDWPLLQSILQKALSSITDAERRAILRQWVPAAEDAQVLNGAEKRLVLSQREQAWLKQHPQLRLGIDPAWEPIEFVNAKGEYLGISAEFIRRIQAMLGVGFKHDPQLGWSEVIEQARQGEIDLLPAITPSPERATYLNFTKPYMHFPLMVFTRQDAHLITGIEDLGEARVAVERGYVTVEYLKPHGNLHLLEVDNTAEALEQLASGRVDAYIGNLTIGSYMIDKLGLGNLKVAAPTPYTSDLAIGVRKDWPELVAIIDKALAAIDENERRAIRQQSLAIRYDVEVNYTLVWQVVAIASILLLLTLLWLAQTKRQKQALATAKAEAERANRFKSHFLANMSHEIRTPMNAIMGFSHLALQTELTPRQQHYLEKISASSHTLLGVINDILDFSKIEAGKLQIERTPFSLDEVLENIASLTSLKAEEKGLEIIFNRGVEVPDRLIGDPLRLGQVLINLVSNAIKFTEQGEVILKVALDQAESWRVLLRFSVQDTGIGIEPRDIERLFGAFTQLDGSTTRRYGGSGLGLSISRHLVQLMGGEIEVESTPGQGSTFHFSIPFNLQDRQAQGDLTPASDLRGLRVLVVDDNPSMREILGERLASFTFEVASAASAEEALRLLERADQQEKRPFKLVLMDWRLPGMDGVEAGRRIKQSARLSHRPAVILITAHGREEVMQQAEAAGLDGFLIKPVSPSVLFDTLIRALNGGQSERPIAARKASMEQRLSGNLLLVEDSQINQQVAQEILESMGLTVRTAANGRQALEALQSHDFDLVLMDIQMPEMDGYEAVRRIRAQARYQRLPIIAMTAHAMTEEREKCLATGMNDHIPKPIDPHALYQLIRQWLKPAYRTTSVAGPVSARDDGDVLPESLPGIDLRAGLERIGGNSGLFLKLLGEFAQHHGNALQVLEENLGKGDLETARREIHTLQGVAGNIGALDLQQEAEYFESDLREGRVSGPDGIPATFRTAFVTLFEAISQIETKPASTQTRSVLSAGPAIEGGELQAGLQELREMLTQGDTAAHGLVSSLLEQVSETTLKQRLQQMKGQIESYDFDTARERLEEIITNMTEHSDE